MNNSFARRNAFTPSLPFIAVVVSLILVSLLKIQSVQRNFIKEVIASYKKEYFGQTLFQPTTTNAANNVDASTVPVSSSQRSQRHYNLQHQAVPKTAGAFLHIGKTAGSTLSYLLRNGCHTFTPKPCMSEIDLPPSKESYISKLTTYYHIPDFFYGNLQTNHQSHPYDFFVITTRDPLQRSISSFVYSHPYTVAEEKLERWKEKNPPFYAQNVRSAKNPKDRGSVIEHLIESGKINEDIVNMYKCFATVEIYAELLRDFVPDETSGKSIDQLLPDNQTKTWKDYYEQRQCDNVAKSTLLHMQPEPMEHNYWDIQEILHLVHDKINQKTKLVIRQEFLWDDWTSANRYVGDEGIIHNNTGARRKYDDMQMPDSMKLNTTLSESGRKNLCFALEKEYRVYLRLLVLADNLSRSDVEKSYEIAKGNCPWLDLKLPDVDDVELIVMSKSRGQWEL